MPQAVPGVLQRFGRKIGAAKPAAASREVADALQAAIEELAKKAPDAEPEEAGEAERRVMLPAVVLPPPPFQPPKPNWDEAVAVMNTQHAIIENVGGKTVIASWEPSPIDPGRLMVVFQNKESFLLRYSNRSVWFRCSKQARRWQSQRERCVGPWWLAHRDRLQFRGVTFRPGGAKGRP